MTDLTPPHQPEFLPKIVTVWREGYTLQSLRADAVAGLTVAIVALPLSMAIAIASGVGPERGLFTAIVGGFLISAVGGSRFQIGGPAGALIVGISACIAQIGLSGLIMATFLSGFILMAAGAARLGRYIKLLPYPVTIGFTAGIALIIFTSQISQLLGLTLTAAEPAPTQAPRRPHWGARGTISLPALFTPLPPTPAIQGIKRWRPHWPNMLIAVIAVSLAVYASGLHIALVADRFGTLPRFLPMPQLPDFSWHTFTGSLTYALQFSLLGAITGLLSAQVADGVSGNRHRASAELFAEGLANIAVSLFGGLYATGAVARTVTNLRAGAKSPVAGMLHALFVLGFMLVLAPLVSFVPMAVFAGLLSTVAWNMAAREQVWSLLKTSRSDAVVVIVTFLLVVFRDLTEGIVAGFALAGLLFLQRMSDSAMIVRDDEQAETQPDRVVLHLSGPYFFGAAAQMGAALDLIADQPRHFVLDLAALNYLDSSGARSLEMLARNIKRKGGQMVLLAVRSDQRRILEQAGLSPPLALYLPNLAALDTAAI